MSTSLAQPINAAFGDSQQQHLPTSTKRSRRKLWELPHNWHCPIIGSCLPVAEMRFGKTKGEAAVLELWRRALVSGQDIAGALWSAWTHADITDDGGKLIHGDIHMLSHQVGASVRGDLPSALA